MSRHEQAGWWRAAHLIIKTVIAATDANLQSINHCPLMVLCRLEQERDDACDRAAELLKGFYKFNI